MKYLVIASLICATYAFAAPTKTGISEGSKKSPVVTSRPLSAAEIEDSLKVDKSKPLGPKRDESMSAQAPVIEGSEVINSVPN